MSCPPRFTTTFAVLDATGKPENATTPQTPGVCTGKNYVVVVNDPESLVWTGTFLLLYGRGRVARLD